MSKIRGRVRKRTVKTSYGTYDYFSVGLPPDLPDSIKKMLKEQDEIILDLSDPFSKYSSRRSRKSK